MFIKGICAIIFSVKVIALYISVLLIISIFIVAIFNILLRSRKYRKNLTCRCNHLQIEVERLKNIRKERTRIYKNKGTFETSKSNESPTEFFC